MFHLKIIIASTRPGRKGPAIADWIYNLARANEAFDVELLDLAAIDLPFFDEPNHPKLQNYLHDHTKKWSETIEHADAFLVVTCEYNFGYPAPLKNAFDYLFREWNYKPVGFVSYGGIAGGTRAVQQLKQVVNALKMMPLMEAVNIPFFTKYINDQGHFNADNTLTKSADELLQELLLWTESMASLRKKVRDTKI